MWTKRVEALWSAQGGFSPSPAEQGQWVSQKTGAWGEDPQTTRSLLSAFSRLLLRVSKCLLNMTSLSGHILLAWHRFFILFADKYKLKFPCLLFILSFWVSHVVFFSLYIIFKCLDPNRTYKQRVRPTLFQVELYLINRNTCMWREVCLTVYFPT